MVSVNGLLLSLGGFKYGFKYFKTIFKIQVHALLAPIYGEWSNWKLYIVRFHVAYVATSYLSSIAC